MPRALAPTRERCTRAIACVALALALTTAAVLAMTPARSVGASSSVTVTMDVMSATSLDLSGCAPESASLAFGTVQPGSSVVTGAACSVGFGSSNDTSMLLMTTHDGLDTTMARRPHAALDNLYDTDGRTSQNMVGTDVGRGVATQRIGANAGKVIVVGFADAGDGSMFVQRRTTGGGIDGTFAGGGTWTFDPTTADDVLRDVVVLSDDSIVAIGVTDLDVGTGDAFMVKLTPDGSLDTSFNAGDGTDGYYLYDGGSADQFEEVTTTDDDELIAAGSVGIDSVVVKFDSSGRLDSSFGTGGMTVFDAGASDNAESIAIDSSGRIVVAGGQGGSPDAWVGRLLADGSLDTAGFNSPAGINVLDFEPADTDVLYGVGIQPSGRIVVVGYARTGGVEYGLIAGVTDAGLLDTTYAAPNGYRYVQVDSFNTRYRRLLMHPDGTTVAVGQGHDAGNDGDVSVSRFSPDGSDDLSFNDTGHYLVDVSGSTVAEDVTFGYEGRYVMTGEGSGNDVGTFRLDSTLVPDQSGGENFGAGTGSFFATCLESVGGAATNVWTMTGACTTADVTPWRAVPDQGDSSTKAATTTSGNTGTANFFFGTRSALTLPPGTYEARITFDVVAPAA